MSVVTDCAVRKCSVCGKEFGVLHPDRWAYKWRTGMNSFKWFCSWRCLREKEKENEKMELEPIVRPHRITPEEKAEAVRRAIEDGSPYEYLNGLGIKAPYSTWKHLKQHLKDHDPETYAKLPERFRGGHGGRPKKAEETPKAAKEPVKEAPKAPVKPLVYDGYTVRCIEGQYGRFYWDETYNRLDWTSPDGEEISFSPQAWKAFCNEILPKVMAILGVNA